MKLAYLINIIKYINFTNNKSCAILISRGALVRHNRIQPDRLPNCRKDKKMSTVRRVYVEKKPEFAVAAKDLQHEIRHYLDIKGVTGVRILISR